MRIRTPLFTLLAAASLATLLAAQQKTSLPAGFLAIRRNEITRDLKAMAGDDMRGREAGTIDEMRASMWVAEEARKAGLEPAGLDGGWFQWWSMRRIQQSASSRVTVGDRSLTLWKDVIVRAPNETSVDLPIINADRASAADRFEGRAVVATLVSVDANRWVSLKEYRDGSAGAARQAQALIARGAAAVILVADANTDKVFDYFASVAMRGTDAKLRDEVILYSGHQGHDGVRFPVDGDSIWNGAEERGLLGSRWHAAHPAVPREQIAAVINGDMIGSNSPDSASLFGSQPPHRNSLPLVRMAIEANKLAGKFAIDSTWDRPTHPEGFYFRSDHAPYARLNIPAIYFTTTLHSAYHTPRDEPELIDKSKLTRMAQWMYLTGWMAANAPQRPPLDPGFKLER